MTISNLNHSFQFNRFSYRLKLIYFLAMNTIAALEFMDKSANYHAYKYLYAIYYLSVRFQHGIVRFNKSTNIGRNNFLIRMFFRYVQYQHVVFCTLELKLIHCWHTTINSVVFQICLLQKTFFYLFFFFKSKY